MDTLNSYLRVNDRLRRLEFVQIRYLGPIEFPELLRDGFVGFLFLTFFFSLIPLNRFTVTFLVILTLIFYIIAIIGMAVTLIAPVQITRTDDGYLATDVTTGQRGRGETAEQALLNLTEAMETSAAGAARDTGA